MGSRWAAHQCLAVAGTPLCRVLNSHLLGVIPASLGVVITMVWALRTPALNPRLRQLAWTALGLLGLQILVGTATLRLHLQIELLTIAHHSIGASLFGILVVFTVLTIRDAIPSISTTTQP